MRSFLLSISSRKRESGTHKGVAIYNSRDLRRVDNEKGKKNQSNFFSFFLDPKTFGSLSIFMDDAGYIVLFYFFIEFQWTGNCGSVQGTVSIISQLLAELQSQVLRTPFSSGLSLVCISSLYINFPIAAHHVQLTLQLSVNRRGRVKI